MESQKREIARLKKELNKAESTISDFLGGDEEGYEEAEKNKARRRGDSLLCEDCGKGTYRELTFTTRDGKPKKYMTCSLCNHRKT
jgi:hypothetical protein